jgi:hypothetical protein
VAKNQNLEISRLKLVHFFENLNRRDKFKTFFDDTAFIYIFQLDLVWEPSPFARADIRWANQ